MMGLQILSWTWCLASAVLTSLNGIDPWKLVMSSKRAARSPLRSLAPGSAVSTHPCAPGIQVLLGLSISGLRYQCSYSSEGSLSVVGRQFWKRSCSRHWAVRWCETAQCCKSPPLSVYRLPRCASTEQRLSFSARSPSQSSRGIWGPVDTACRPCRVHHLGQE